MKTVSTKIAAIVLAIVCFYFYSPEICGAQTALDSLTYYGHSFVKIKTAQGMVIYIDPYNVNVFTDSADVVLITHEHSDHNDINRVRQKSTCQMIRAANAISGSTYNTFTIGSVTVKAVAAYNSNHSKSSCVGFVVIFNGIKLYHAGDTGNITEMADLTSQHITYALLPMDGIYTITPEVATTCAATIQAAHDIPIHTMPPPDTYSDAIVARFTSPNKMIVHPGSTIELSIATTGIEDQQSVPSGFRLEQNYPNPFNPTTTIRYQVPTTSNVYLKVNDILGREVATLVEGTREPGSYSVTFDGSGLASGIYFVRFGIQWSNGSTQFTKTMKMLLAK